MTKEHIGYSRRFLGLSFYVMDDFGNLVDVPKHDFHALLITRRISFY